VINNIDALHFQAKAGIIKEEFFPHGNFSQNLIVIVMLKNVQIVS